MKKSFTRIISAVMVLLMMFSLFACVNKGNGNGGDIEFDEEGNIKPGPSGEVIVKFWGSGDEEETIVFTKIVEEFNKKYQGVIRVDYTQRPYDSYGETLLTVLSG